MPTPVYVSKGTFTSGVGALSVPVPTGYTEGNAFLLFVESANEAIATPAGWTQVANSPQNTGGAAAIGGVRLAVFWKNVEATEAAVTVADSGNHTTAIIMEFKDCHYASPINVSAGSAAAANTALSWPSVTTTEADCLIVLAAAFDTDAASTTVSSGYTNANLTSITERHDQTVTAGVGGGLVVATGIKATAGATGATTGTGSTSVTHAYLTIALHGWTTVAASDINLLSAPENMDHANWATTITTLVVADVSADLRGATTVDEATFNLTGNGNLRQHVTGLTIGEVYTLSGYVQQGRTGSATATRVTTNNLLAWNTGSSTKVTLTGTLTRVSTTWKQIGSTSAALMIGAVDVAGGGDADGVGKVRISSAMLNVGSSAGVYPTGPVDDGTGHVFSMQPQAVTALNQTSAPLAISRTSYNSPYRFKGQTRTAQQLRQNDPPNAWEVTWMIWHYQDTNNFFYFTIKPNGWEIGKRDPAYFVAGVNDGQRIIATGNSPTMPVGQWYAFDIQITGSDALIYVDGKLIHSFVADEGPYWTSGKVGMYGEDAKVQFDNFEYPLVDNFEGENLTSFVDGSLTTNWEVVYLGGGSGGIINGYVSSLSSAVTAKATSSATLSSSATGIASVVTGRAGAWFTPTPVGNFIETISPDVPATTDGQYFRKWLDSSGNGNHIQASDEFHKGVVGVTPLPAGYMTSRFDATAGGGATTGFYFCFAADMNSYYGEVFSDINTANTGFRVEHSGDYGGMLFSVGTGAARTEMVLLTDPTYYTTMGLACVEFWYDGTTMYARENKGTTISQACGTVSVGRAGFHLFATTEDVNLASGDYFQVTYLKNYVPNATERDIIADESMLAAGMLSNPILMASAATAKATSTSSLQTIAGAPPATYTALWSWNESDFATAGARQALVSFAVSKGITTIYQNAQAGVVSGQAALTALLDLAAANGIAIEFLFGDANWTYTANHQQAIDLVTASNTYIAGLTNKPTGYHFDVEPHTLGAPWFADPVGLGGQLIDLYVQLQAARPSSIRLNADIALGYKDVNITRNTVTKTLSQWLVDATDTLTIMAYRDFALGEDSITFHADHPVTYAATVGKRVYVAVETQFLGDPEKVSFFEEGPVVLDTELAAVRTYYASNAGFGGIAIHDYVNYKLPPFAPSFSANSIATATSTSALTTSVRLGSVATATALSGASLQVGVRLAATTLVNATATGALTTTIRLASTANAIASATGALTVGVRLAASALGTATSGATLRIGALLASGATATASSTSALATSIRLSSAPVAVAASTGALAVGALLAASATGKASSTGALSTSVTLASAGASLATSSGALLVGVLLGANASVIATSGASLSSGAGFAAASSTVATSTASLATTIRLASTALATASVGGSLVSGGLFASFGSANMTSTGALATGIRLASPATATASSTGALLVGRVLAANASVTASTTGALLVGTLFATNTVASASSTSALQVGALLESDAGAIATSVSDLRVGVFLASNAVVTATSTAGIEVRGEYASHINAKATSTGALQTSVRMASAASVTGTVTGDLDTTIALAGASQVVAVATGSLSTSVTLASSAQALAATTSALRVGVLLGATLGASASSTSNLVSAASYLASLAITKASSSSALATGIQLQSSSAVLAVLRGTLTSSSSSLAAILLSTSTSTGSLRTGALLASDAVVTVAATGTLVTQTQFSAASVATVTSVSALVTGVFLEAASYAVAVSTGYIPPAYASIGGAKAVSFPVTPNLAEFPVTANAVAFLVSANGGSYNVEPDTVILGESLA